MRQQKWMEYLKDDDFTMHDHPGKANVVVDALNRKSRGVLASVGSRVVDARGYVQVALQGPSLGYFREFSGYAFLTEQSN